jgi:anti-anti-sigma factor
VKKGFEVKRIDGASGVVILRVIGPLAADSGTELVSAVAQLPPDQERVVINLSQVSFISSSGVGALMSIADQCHEAGTMIRLADLSPAVMSVMDLLDLHELIAIDSTEEEAIARLAAA